MVLTNIKNKQKESGFTIVELLVVIVVIGILAAITIVSYTGITAKANTTSNLSNANSVVSAVSGVFAESSTGTYPAWTTDSNTTKGLINAGVSKIPNSITLQNTTATAGTNIGYVVVTNGVCVSYWDYTLATPAARFLGVGNATVAADHSTCS